MYFKLLFFIVIVIHLAFIPMCEVGYYEWPTVRSMLKKKLNLALSFGDYLLI